MRSILLQLHTGSPANCESWLNAPVAHGVQLTVYNSAILNPLSRSDRRSR
jgi:hypothetical protein